MLANIPPPNLEEGLTDILSEFLSDQVANIRNNLRKSGGCSFDLFGNDDRVVPYDTRIVIRVLFLRALQSWYQSSVEVTRTGYGSGHGYMHSNWSWVAKAFKTLSARFGVDIYYTIRFDRNPETRPVFHLFLMSMVQPDDEPVNGEASSSSQTRPEDQTGQCNCPR